MPAKKQTKKPTVPTKIVPTKAPGTFPMTFDLQSEAPKVCVKFGERPSEFLTQSEAMIQFHQALLRGRYDFHLYRRE